MTRYSANPSTLTRSVGGSTVLYLYANDDSVVINAIGRAIWDAIDASPGPIGLDDLTVYLATAFSAEPHQIRGQVADFTEGLAGRGFLSRAE